MLLWEERFLVLLQPVFGERLLGTFSLGMSFCDLEYVSTMKSLKTTAVVFGSISCSFMSLLIGHILCPPCTHGEQASQGLGLAFHCRQSTRKTNFKEGLFVFIHGFSQGC